MVSRMLWHPESGPVGRSRVGNPSFRPCLSVKTFCSQDLHMSASASEPVQNPFARLGLQPRMDLRVAEIDAAYRRAIGHAHPDRLDAGDAQLGAGGGQGSTSDSESTVEAVNEARRVLVDPESRARAIFAILLSSAETASEKSKSPEPGADQDALPDGFLMQIMETRMAIEHELAGAGSGTDSEIEAARERWEDWAQEQRTGAIGDVTAHFDAIRAAGDESARAAALGDARRALNAWRYIERLIEQLDPDHRGLD
jgi:curved DNA-binding protein CbpA